MMNKCVSKILCPFFLAIPPNITFTPLFPHSVWNKGVCDAWRDDEEQWEASGPDREGQTRDQDSHREMQHGKYSMKRITQSTQ